MMHTFWRDLWIVSAEVIDAGLYKQERLLERALSRSCFQIMKRLRHPVSHLVRDSRPISRSVINHVVTLSQVLHLAQDDLLIY